MRRAVSRSGSIVVGITGGLAAGKSTVTRMFRDRGAATFSADQASRAVLVPHGQVLADIVAAFGSDVVRGDGSLDRAELARRAFTDDVSRERLNCITHPAILRLLHSQIEGAQYDFSAGLVIAVEVPLLFEANLSDWFELIVVVGASEPTQIARLIARNAQTADEAVNRLRAQWTIAEKAKRADFVIWNDGSENDLDMAVERVWERISQSALRNDQIV